MPEQNVYSDQIDYKNKIKTVKVDTSLKDIDTSDELYADLEYINDKNSSSLLSEFNNFPTVSRSRDNLYDAFDTMCEDSRIAAAINIYTAESTEQNKNGDIVWCDSADADVSTYVSYLLDCLNVNKYAPVWMNSLVRYGDAYLRLYRDTELNKVSDSEQKKGIHFSAQLNEDLIIKAFNKKDHYNEYIELNRNPAEVFELQKMGKTVAYVKTNIETRNNNSNEFDFNSYFYRYNFDLNDVEVYPSDSFVHACLEDVDTRHREEVVLGDAEYDEKYNVVYSVRRGKSILYDVYKIWKTLSLLENAILLNRLTKSSIVKIVEVETGDMDKNKVQSALLSMKNVIEQKVAIDSGKNFSEYLNTSPVENLVFTAVHDGKGAVNVKELGGSDKSLTDQLNDLDYFKTKLYAALGIPKAYLGDTSDSTGFNGGTSLTLISSQFAKTCKRLQNALCAALTDCINLMLVDKGMYSYINKFTLKMQAPTTQEEKDRQDAYSAKINSVRDTLDIITSNGIDDTLSRMRILKELLSGLDMSPAVLNIIQNKINEAEEAAKNGNNQDSQIADDNIGGGDLGFSGGFDDGGFNSNDMNSAIEAPAGMESTDELNNNELNTSDISGLSGAEPMENSGEQAAPVENFYNGSGMKLNEQNSLPTWSDLGLSYNNVKIGG